MNPKNLYVVEPRALEGQSRAVLREWLAADPLGGIVVLAPSRPVGRLLVREAVRERGGAVNIQAATFHDLARKMVTPLESVKELPAGADRLIVGELLRRDPGPFGARAARPGVAAAYARSLRDLRLAGLETLPPLEDLKLTNEERRRLTHLDRLARAFDAHLQTHRLFDEARLYLAAREGNLPTKNLRILIHAVYDFTAVQLEWIESLTQKTQLVWVMPAVDGAGEETLGFFQRDAELKERGFVEQPGLEPPAEPPLEILACPGQQAEGRTIARRILSAAEQGVPFGDMAVILTTPADQEPSLLAAFDRTGIPVAERPLPRLLDRPQGRVLSALIELAGEEGSLVHAAALLRAVQETTDEETVPPSRVEWLIRRAGCARPKGASWSTALQRLAKTLERQADRAQDEDADEEDATQTSPGALREAARQAGILGRRAAKCLGAIENFRERFFSQTENWNTVSRNLQELVREFFGGTAVADRAVEAAQSLAGLEALAVPPTLETALEEFRQRLAQAGAATDEEDPLPRRRPGEGVTLLTIDRARGLSARRVWVAGLGELDFPPRENPDPLLTDALRAQIQNAGFGFLPLSTRRAGEAGLLFDLVCATATEALTLSWARVDDNTGITRLPADRLVRKIETHSGPSHPEIKDPILAPCVTRVQSDHPPSFQTVPFLDTREFSLARSWSLGGKSPISQDPQERRRLEAWTQRWRNRALTPHDGVIGPGVIPVAHLSVTDLETFATCPRKFLLGRVLALEPLGEAEQIPAPDPRDVGKLAHEVLEQIFENLENRPLPAAPEWARIIRGLQALVDERREILLRRGVLGHPALWAAQAAVIGRDLAFFLLEERDRLEEQNRRPVKVEWPRSEVLAIAETEVEIRGKIDRVDQDAEGSYWITDYKWSKGRGYSAKNLFEGGRRLQLPLYAWLLMEREMEKTGPGRFGGARFAFLRGDRERDEVIKERDEITSQSKALDSLITLLFSSIRSGAFFPVTGNGDNCEYCDFRNLCGPAIVRLEKLKSGDPRYQQHAQLQEEFK